MHDHNGKPLAVGDIVLIPCRIKSLQASNEDYCNVNLTTIYGRRPDGAFEGIGAINTGVLVRANSGDMNDADYPNHDPRPAPIETLQQQQERLGLMPSTQGPGAEPVHNDENA